MCVSERSILADTRAGAWTFRFLEGVERWMLRLLAYQAGLVDAYPPFALSEDRDLYAAAAGG
jgi:hypothetical protein